MVIQWTLVPLTISSLVDNKKWILHHLDAFNTTAKAKHSKTGISTPNHQHVKEKILARIQDLPNWVYFPDYDRSEWINRILNQLWPSLEEMIIKKVCKSKSF